ncbi:uncharacterized protein LOC122402661 [Colletes gigas]|uniref:uncharacterized protein LOC122402661 n=1 Tax=Colletes gigas TaxID=935657 RepID=UPI001C9BB152|nr:uncharacterized protein LOC122402661 [Colletes gigas]
MHTSGDFILHGGDTAFANRQKLLFDRLSDAEQECNRTKSVIESTDVDMAIDESNKSIILRAGQKRKSELKRFRGKESIFKRPEGPAPRAVNRSVPDYHRNPHKWMRYSLDDVSNDDMTEQSNTRAALSFLKELKARRSLKQIDGEREMDVDEIASTGNDQTKTGFTSKKVKAISDIEFKKPERDAVETLNTSIVIEHNDKPVFRSSKIIMPEYVVGQKQKKKNKKEKRLEKVDRLKQLKLGHLEEFDEDDN